uniref:Uncharacterized protein n=1 Tax=Theileria annulata TaxID=5874 RepID=A0A3B0MR93_THEAN
MSFDNSSSSNSNLPIVDSLPISNKDSPQNESQSSTFESYKSIQSLDITDEPFDTSLKVEQCEDSSNSCTKVENLPKAIRLTDFNAINAFKNFLSNPLGSKTLSVGTEQPNELDVSGNYQTCRNKPEYNRQESLSKEDVYNLSDEFVSNISTSTSSDIDESQYLAGESEVDLSTPLKLKDLMIYKTIQFMDYRRFSRRFNGIRKPVSYKKAMLIFFFCAVLALTPFVVFRRHDEHYTISIQIKRGMVTYISSLAFVIAAFLLAKAQVSLPLRFPVILSYIFMVITMIVLIVFRNIAHLDVFIWTILISFASEQVFVIAITKLFIHYVPILALHGRFLSCTEHFHLIKRTQHANKINITMSRYNDYTTIWESGSCGFFTCIYRSFYRFFLSLHKRIKGRTNQKDEPLFGHQMRYNGKFDSNNLPHGYGEWLEDHIYGERLQGYWWHGYPVGPFTSQEIGSGSIFVNNRVAFVTDTHLEGPKIRYGVSSTECSISGYFFKQMPKTYFFNPDYREVGNCKKEPCDLFNLLRESFDGIKSSTPQWCFGMLKRQFHINRPNNQGYMNIYVDKITNSLKIDGYRIKKTDPSAENPDEINIKLVMFKGKRKDYGPPDDYQSPVELKLFKPSTTSLFNKLRIKNNDKDGNSKQRRGCKSQIKSRISMLIRDEDEWENKKQMCRHKIVASGWKRIRPSTNPELIPEHVVLYIHGYNLTLYEACSQMAHIVSFSKLPPYILPFVFNWKGHHWGMFSAFSYPKAVKICTNPNIVDAFIEVIEDLIKLGIKHIHFLVHSCGTRVFLNVILSAIKKGYIVPVLSDEYLVIKEETKKDRLRMDSIILINPDYPMEKFRSYDYFVIRGYCDHIVMYVNNMDQCLYVSEFYNREQSLGRSIFEMCTSSKVISNILKKEYIDEPFTIYEGYCRSAKKSEFDKDHRVVILDQIGELSTPSDGNSPYSKETRVENFELLGYDEKRENKKSKFGARYSLGKYAKTKNIFWTSRISSKIDYEGMELWLDLDVVDTSMIDTNVDFFKHSFYQVKREIMDDIREVIIMHTRAFQRQSRLDRRRGNVYVFRVAPRDVSKLL